MSSPKYQLLTPHLTRPQHFLARRKPLAALLALFLLLLLVSLHSDLRLRLHDLRPAANPHATGADSDANALADLQLAQRPKAPTLDDLEAGHWVRKAERPDLSREWRGAYVHTEGLPPPLDGETVAHTWEEIDLAKRARAVELASWEWVGEGAITEKVGWEEIAVRALRSSGGIMLIGDSLQGQLFKHIRDAVFPAAALYHVTHTDFVIRGTTHRVPAYETLSLASSSPLAQELARRAGAPPERLARPVVTFVRDDLMLSAEETAGIVTDVLHKTGHSLGRTTNLVYGNWTRRVERATRLVRTVTDDGVSEWEGDRPTVLLMNTGGHWSPRSFLDFNESHMLDAYRLGFISIMAAVRSLSRTLPIYRPSIPGHAQCTTYRTPVASASELHPLMYAENYGWNLFTVYNDILVTELLRAEGRAPETVGGVGDSNTVDALVQRTWEEDEKDLEGDDGAWRSAAVPNPPRVSLEGPRPTGYLPVFQRSLLRPEAHRVVLDAFGQPDCLHLAGPSVLEEWLNWAWKELVVMEQAL